MNPSCRPCTAMLLYLVKNQALLVRRHGWILPSSALLAFQPSSSDLEAKERMLLSSGLTLSRCSAASKCWLQPLKSSVADGSDYAGTTTRNLWLAMRADPGVSPQTSPSSVTSCGSTLVVIITPRA